jgi:hypothetical protein
MLLLDDYELSWQSVLSYDKVNNYFEINVWDESVAIVTLKLFVNN